MKYISYSIWGDDQRYFDGLVACVDQNKQVYPGWKTIIYASTEISAEWKRQLDRMDVEVEYRSITHPWDGQYWRFEVVDRPDCEIGIVRDSDSPSSLREAELVERWVASGRALHIIRDNLAHDMPMLAGMWGARGGFGKPMAAQIHAWRWKNERCGDQHFLRKHVYLKHWRDACVHSSSVAFNGESVDWVMPVEDYIGRPFFSPGRSDLSETRIVLKRPGRFKVLRQEYYLCRDAFRKKMGRGHART